MIDIRQKLDEIGPFVPGADDGLLVCRCEEVTKGEIRKAVDEGSFIIEEMRRYLRNGMGRCRGRSCSRLVKSIMAAELKEAPDYVEPASARAPMRPIEMEILGKDQGGKHE